MDSNSRIIELRTVEAQSVDVGHGIARLDPKDVEYLGASIGDTLEITGRRSTVVKVIPADDGLCGQNLLQIDGIVRENAGVRINEIVTARVVAPQPAISLQLIPVTLSSRRHWYTNYIGKLLNGLNVVEGDRVRATLFGARFQEFKVYRTDPDGIVVITPDTTFTITDPKFQVAGAIEKQAKIAYEDVGGLKREIESVREMIELPLKHAMIFEQFGIDPPRRLLFTGPPGVGKALVAKVIAQEVNAYFIMTNGPEILHKLYGEPETRLRQIFEEAGRNQPAIVFIDDIDILMPRRETLLGEVERRAFSQLLTLMDGLRDRGQVVLIGATSNPHLLDSSLRCPGRFDREVQLRAPNVSGRIEILKIYSRGMTLDPSVDLTKLAAMTHGFVGADLQGLCHEAAMTALHKNMMKSTEISLSIVEEQLDTTKVTIDDFQHALKLIKPSATNEITAEVPDIHWNQVGGLDDIRQELTRAILLPFVNSNVFEDFSVRSARSVFLYGPPGVGKTFLVKALACEGHINLIVIRSAQLLSSGSNYTLTDIFHQARQFAPCIVFFDEIDSLVVQEQVVSSLGVASSKSNLLGELLIELDRVKQDGVFIIAATNRIDKVNTVISCCGHFDLVLEIPLPDVQGLSAIWKIYLQNKLLADDINILDLAEKTIGFSGAEVEEVCKRASVLSLEKWVVKNSINGEPPKLTQEELVKSIELVRRMKCG